MVGDNALKENYESQWDDYRRGCKLGIYSLITFFVSPFVMIPTLGFLLHFRMFQFLTNVSQIPFLIEVVLLIATGYFYWRFHTWQCPRCGEPFGRLHEECQNCGLPKWSSENECEFSREDVESCKAEWPKPRI
jgi:hypothetical protein